MRKMFRSTIYKVITNTIKVLLILIMFIYIMLISLQYLSLKGSIFGYRFFNITDTSMIKKYKINDILIIDSLHVDKLKVNDDILYIGDSEIFKDEFIVHRIVKIDKSEIITKGIDSRFDDPPIVLKNVLGKVVGVVPVFSEFNKLLRNPLMFLLIIVIPVIIILVLDIIKTISDIKAEKLITSLD